MPSQKLTVGFLYFGYMETAAEKQYWSDTAVELEKAGIRIRVAKQMFEKEHEFMKNHKYGKFADIVEMTHTNKNFKQTLDGLILPYSSHRMKSDLNRMTNPIDLFRKIITPNDKEIYRTHSQIRDLPKVLLWTDSEESFNKSNSSIYYNGELLFMDKEKSLDNDEAAKYLSLYGVHLCESDAGSDLVREVRESCDKGEIGPLSHVYVIVAPSGSGKSTLTEFLSRYLPNLKTATKITTSRPRPFGLDEGKEYISQWEFDMLKKEDRILGANQLHGKSYGYQYYDVRDNLTKGYDVIMDTSDVDTAILIRNTMPNQVKIVTLDIRTGMNLNRLIGRYDKTSLTDNLKNESEQRIDDILHDYYEYQRMIMVADYILPDKKFMIMQKLLRRYILDNRKVIV